MSDTRKVLVVTDKRTVIKKIKIGAPIRNVTSGGISTSTISDINTTDPSGGDILVYQPSTQTYYTAALTGGTNLEVVYDSDSKDILTINTTLESLSSSIIPDSNEVYDLGSSTKKFRDLYLSGSTLNLGTIQLQDSGGSFVVKDSAGNTIFTEVALTTTNGNILSYDSSSGVFSFNDSDIARTDINEIFHKSLTVADALNANSVSANSATIGGVTLESATVSASSISTDSIGFSVLTSGATTTVRNIFSSGTGLTYDSAGGQFSITNTGVTLGIYGSSTQVPQLTINAQGQIDSAGLVTIAGVTGVDFDSATGTFTVQTTGGDFSDVITLDPYTTSNLVEGSNLYYTTARADSDAKNAVSVTDAGGDGSLTYSASTGIFTYTGPSATEVRAHLVAGTGITYDSATGVVSIGQPVETNSNVTFNDVQIDGNLTVSGTTTTVNTETINLADNTILLNSNLDSGEPTENSGIEISRGDEANKSLLWNESDDKWTVGSETFVAGRFEGPLTGDVTGQVSDISNHSTTEISEGTNLYYTTARADSAFDVRLATKSTTDVSEGTNLYYTTVRADSDAKNAISVTDAGGDGSLTYSASTGVITYTGPSATEIRAHLVEGTGLTYDSATGVFSITNTGVVAGTYGSDTAIPVITINAQGQIDSVGTIGVSGITGVDFDSATGTLTINTSTGNFTDVLTLDPYTTTDLVEGTNLYYTTARADSDAKNAVSVTDAGGDGSLTYDAGTGVFTYTGPSASEVRAHFSASGDLIYDSATGQFSIDVEQVYTKANFDSDFDVRISEKSTTDLAEGTNLYYTTARADSDAKNAISVTDAGGDGSLTYDAGTGVFTYTGPSASDVRAHINVSGDLAYDSATGQLSFTQRTDQEVRDIFSVSGSLAYDSATGQFSFTERTDQEVRNLFSASGDLTYDSATGQFSFDVEQIYTKANFDSDFDVRLGEKTTDNLTQGSTNLYYDSATTQTNARNAISVTDAGGDGSLTYDAATGVITYTGPSASEVRAHINVSGNLAYDSATGQLSFTQRTDQEVRNLFSVSGDLSYDSATGQFSFTERTDQEVRNLMVAGTGITYDSATGVISISQDVATSADVTFGKVTLDSAVVNQQINFAPTTIIPTAAGSLYYDSDPQKGLSFIPTTTEGVTDVTINIGQEFLIYVHNLTGAQINNGQAVYVSGTAHGAHPQVSLSKADTASTARVDGVATMNIPDGAHGYITKYGLVRDVNTGGLVAGADVYLSKDSAGEWSTTEVSIDDGYPFHIGKIVRVDSSTGSIFVDPWTENYEYLRIQDRLRIDGKIQVDSAEVLTIDFDTATFPSSHQQYKEGRLFYDNEHKTLNYYSDITNVPHEVGLQEYQRIWNNTGSAIAKGAALYFSGNYTSGIIDVPTVGLADATDVNAYNAQGIAADSIGDNAYGYVLISGQLTDVNTSHLSDGTNFFVGLTPGATQNASPTYPNYPMCLGWVVKSDSATGILLVNQQNHSVNSFRVRTSAHIGDDLLVGGNLIVNGTQTITSTANVQIGGNIQYLNAGDTIGEAGTTFVGSGLDDAFFAGHYSGDSSTKSFYVKIDSAGPTDTFEWGFDSSVGAVATGITVTGAAQLLTAGISIDFGATTGHTLGDVWAGTATAVDVDTGFFSNRNTGDAGNGYTHIGLFFDVSEDKWRLLSKYDSEPDAPINLLSPSLEYGTLVVSSLEGNVTGNITGNASTATSLASGRDFSITGDITAGAVSFNGTGNVTLNAAITAGSIVNADINASAAIADTKLATISTSGKVQNSATTATALNTGSAIVTRDPSGNFAAGDITASLTGNVTGNLTGEVDRTAHTSVIAGIYGSNTAIPVFTIDSNGFIDSAGTVGVSGITGVDFDSATGTLTIQTSTGNFTDVLTLDPFTTDNLTEGSTNLYYDSARTVTTARNAISASGDISYDAATGVISYSTSGTAFATYYFTADSGQTTFTGTDDNGQTLAYTENYLLVTVNGVVIQNVQDYTATNGTSVVLSVAADSADEVNIVSFSTTPFWNQSNLTTTDGKIIHDQNTETTVTTTSVVDSFAHDSSALSLEYLCSARDSDAGESQVTKILATYDGTNVASTEYGTVYTGLTNLGEYSVAINGANIELSFTREASRTVKTKISKTVVK